jgi:hypothetical protein
MAKKNMASAFQGGYDLHVFGFRDCISDADRRGGMALFSD